MKKKHRTQTPEGREKMRELVRKKKKSNPGKDNPPGPPVMPELPNGVRDEITRGPKTFTELRQYASYQAAALASRLALRTSQADHEAITLALMSAYDQGVRDSPLVTTIQKEAAQ